MRRVLLLLALPVVGCSPPLIVDCDPGVFARIEDEPWCVYPSGHACPDLLPAAHDLPWGGRGCTSEPVDPLPEHPCLESGDCVPGDAG